ncbi:hypothetical protein CDL12_10613 [Handroanthus impetiginosus]|uniref:F-box associated beta-propeller type 3 domain-containing protein n=1 Tax=Handroanthus impetiginosus TaxID=429701 RepID=A0A2G9HGW0_9LAMI|nr:hypothetical protein CDL12_10613 [Handroanthus impetiginosus]
MQIIVIFRLTNQLTHFIFWVLFSGLICININRNKYFLWNPSTRESKKLPDFDVEILSYRHTIEDGFGFDESSSDYNPIAEVYTLKQNSWTRINHNKDDFELSTRTGHFVGGNLHWMRMKSNKWRWRWYISSLDLKNDVYGIVERPSALDDYSRILVLGVVNGCLSVFCYYQDCEFSDLWVLNHYGVQESWKKNREVLFRHGWELVAYKSKEECFWYLETNRSKCFLQLVYVESLVSVVVDVEE